LTREKPERILTAAGMIRNFTDVIFTAKLVKHPHLN
jgi:hypothetical protein